MSTNSDTQVDSSNIKDTVIGSSTHATADTAPSDDVLDIKQKKLFSTQDFMSFLVNQVDISKLIVETKDGQRISASFNGSLRPPSGDNVSIFKSLDMLQSLDSTGGDDSVESTVARATVSLEFLKDGKADPAASNRKVGAATSLGANPFESREWAAEYANTHVEVSYSSCFGEKLPPPVAAGSGNHHEVGTGALSDLGQVATAAAAGTSLPPKKRAARESVGSGNGKTDWYAMYNSALKPLVEAASLAQKEQPVESAVAGASGNMIPPTTTSNAGAGSSSNCGYPKKKRKPRKIVPEVKQYVKFTDKDVLFGRGGRSNHHIGNKIYREIVTEQQAHYRACDKNEKTKVAQAIVDRVHNDIGGRFLELDTATGKWFLVPNVVARRKVGQALRENNTEEARAAKRAKYQGGKASKKEIAALGKSSEDSVSLAAGTAQFV